MAMAPSEERCKQDLSSGFVLQTRRKMVRNLFSLKPGRGCSDPVEEEATAGDGKGVTDERGEGRSVTPGESGSDKLDSESLGTDGVEEDREEVEDEEREGVEPGEDMEEAELDGEREKKGSCVVELEMSELADPEGEIENEEVEESEESEVLTRETTTPTLPPSPASFCAHRARS